jgi:hypothetical protein
MIIREAKMSFWVYENKIHKYASLHEAKCSFCGDGHGLHGGGLTPSGMWHGPFGALDDAKTAAIRTGQPDLRSCSLCVGGEVIFSSTARSEDTAKTDSDVGQQLKCSLVLRWLPKGRLQLDESGRIVFPRVESCAGIYRFSARYPDGRFANYIGESDNLYRRFGNYRNPGSSQLTNIRINFWMKELLGGGGEASISIAESALLNDVKADFTHKAVRRMFEQMAIVLGHAEDIESLNR